MGSGTLAYETTAREWAGRGREILVCVRVREGERKRDRRTIRRNEEDRGSDPKAETGRTSISACNWTLLLHDIPTNYATKPSQRLVRSTVHLCSYYRAKPAAGPGLCLPSAVISFTGHPLRTPLPRHKCAPLRRKETIRKSVSPGFRCSAPDLGVISSFVSDERSRRT